MLVWFAVYHLLGEDGFLASTVDRVDALWIQWTVLNLPLQLLAGIAVLGLRMGRKPLAAGVLAAISFSMMGAHVLISLLA